MGRSDFSALPVKGGETDGEEGEIGGLVGLGVCVEKGSPEEGTVKGVWLRGLVGWGFRMEKTVKMTVKGVRVGGLVAERLLENTVKTDGEGGVAGRPGGLKIV